LIVKGEKVGGKYYINPFRVIKDKKVKKAE